MHMQEMEEEDMDYVTLARAGGRKDLLRYIEDLDTHHEPVPYPWVEWFDHVHPPAPPDTQLPPVVSRNPSTLLTWPNSLNATSNKVPKRTMSLPQATVIAHKTSKQLRRLPNKKHPKLPTINEPINMKALLSLEYQKEWVRQNNKKLAEEKRIRKEKKQLQQEKLIEHSMKKRSINVIDKVEKERFVMKRFRNIPPKVKLPPINPKGGTIST